MAMMSEPICAPTAITAVGAVSAKPGRIWAVLLNGGTDDTSIEFTNDADGSGDNVFELEAPHTTADASSKSSVYISFVDIGGVSFSSKCYADITGTAATAYVWYA